MRSFVSYHRQEEGRLMQLTRNSVPNLEWGEARTFGAGTQIFHRAGIC